MYLQTFTPFCQNTVTGLTKFRAVLRMLSHLQIHTSRETSTSIYSFTEKKARGGFRLHPEHVGSRFNRKVYTKLHAEVRKSPSQETPGGKC
jgi:hypothetical protein